MNVKFGRFCHELSHASTIVVINQKSTNNQLKRPKLACASISRTATTELPCTKVMNFARPAAFNTFDVGHGVALARSC